MFKFKHALFAALAALALLSGAPGVPSTVAHARAAAALSSLWFEANQGQAPADAQFLAHGQGYSLSLAAAETTLTLWDSAPSANAAAPRRASAWRGQRLLPSMAPRLPQSTTVRIYLVAADTQAPGTGVDRIPARINYAIGQDPSRWHSNVAAYAGVHYANVYPGIDVIYYGNARRQLEYDFVIAPLADPNLITLEIKGTDSLRIDEQGDLVLHTAAGEIHQRRPAIFQDGVDGRQTVSGGYVLRGEQQVGFAIGAYDPARTLVVDPVLVYSTYFGGPGYPGSPDKDNGYAIAVDSAGNAYVTGATNSIGRWDADAYVVKFDPTGATLLYKTYLDGNGGDDAGNAIAIDAAGSAYITGSVANEGVFVAKLSPAGSPVYFVIFGANPGYSMDLGTDIAVDATGNAYVTGVTYLPFAGNFPTTPGAFQPSYGGGNWDAFVVKLNGQGGFVYSTFLGGNAEEEGLGIAVDGSANVYVVGGTTSEPPSVDCPACTPFPVTPGSFQPNPGGGQDAFVTKLNPTGSALVYSTYVGGRGDEQFNGIALDAVRNAYVTGLTTMTAGENNFPTVNAFKSNYSGGVSDSVYAKLNAQGSALVYSSYLSGHDGGWAGDAGIDIAVDGAGNAYVTGSTTSIPDSAIGPGSLGFPVVNALQPQLAGAADAFVTKVAPTGNTLVFSTYLGGTGSDKGSGIALGPNGDAYLVGQTSSDDFPTTTGVYQPRYGGGDCAIFICADTFVARIGGLSCLAPLLPNWNGCKALYLPAIISFRP